MNSKQQKWKLIEWEMIDLIDRGQKGAFRAVASQKKICLLEHQNAFAAIQRTFIGIIFVTILSEVSIE